MPEREVTQVLARYTDADGTSRYGLQGETVTVHNDDVKLLRRGQRHADVGGQAGAEEGGTEAQSLTTR
jgi:hypothetical protein